VRDADASTAGDQPYILEFSAGNAGPDSETMDSPASGKNVIATGASENVAGTLAETYGLYADGPDTMAIFPAAARARTAASNRTWWRPGTGLPQPHRPPPDEAAIAWSAIDDYYVYMGGTSMSGPHAAGAAAVFVQYYKSLHTNAVPSPALVKAALINSADELDEANGGPGPIPNNDEGWGRINLANIIVTNINSAPRFYQYLDQTVLLTNSQVYSQHIFVQGSDQPLKITLALHGRAGISGRDAGAGERSGFGSRRPGWNAVSRQQFGAGESVPNAPSPDKLNNVEGVYSRSRRRAIISCGCAPAKSCRMRASNTPAIDQDFALVASGDLARPGTGIHFAGPRPVTPRRASCRSRC
jgi:hypothetical protein